MLRTMMSSAKLMELYNGYDVTEQLLGKVGPALLTFAMAPTDLLSPSNMVRLCPGEPL